MFKNIVFYFIVQLKRAKVPTAYILICYCACIRQFWNIACQVYHYGLPGYLWLPCYLSNAIELVQKRIMSIIYPSLSFDDSLALSGISKLSSRREEACIKLFNEIVNIPDHKLAYLSTPKQETKDDLRQSRVFTDYTVNVTQIDF